MGGVEASRRWRRNHPGAGAADSRARRRRNADAIASEGPGAALAVARREVERERTRAWQAANRGAARAATRSWQLRNKEAATLASRRWHLKKTYGLTLEVFAEMAAAQGGRCAICDDPPAEGMNLAVDHDHGSGAVRKLLCSTCNLAVGLLRERPVLAARLADYLREHGR